MQATKYGPCPEPASVWRRGPDKRSVGRLEVERAVWPRCVVVRGVLRQQRPQVPFVDDYQMVETLPSQRPDEAIAFAFCACTGVRMVWMPTLAARGMKAAP